LKRLAKEKGGAFLKSLRRNICAAALVLLVNGIGFAQGHSDVCHVYVVDVEKARKAQEISDEKALEKALAEAETVFPEFSTVVGEEELTTKTYTFPGGGLFIKAQVFYTDESMASADSANSMLLSIIVSPKPQKSELLSVDNALAEVTYNNSTDTVRVKKYIKVRRRSYLVGLECHAKPLKN
jgi:hypothetical protein